MHGVELHKRAVRLTERSAMPISKHVRGVKRVRQMEMCEMLAMCAVIIAV
jgi:hypothetical protein